MTNDDPNQTDLIDSYPHHEAPEPPRQIQGEPNPRTTAPTEFDVTLIGQHAHVVGYDGPDHDREEDIRIRIALIDWGPRPVLFECSFLGRLLWVSPGVAYANPTDEQCAGALHATEEHSGSRRWLIRDFGEPLPEAPGPRPCLIAIPRMACEPTASATATLTRQPPETDPYDDLPAALAEALRDLEGEALSGDLEPELFAARRAVVEAIEAAYEDDSPDSCPLCIGGEDD